MVDILVSVGLTWVAEESRLAVCRGEPCAPLITWGRAVDAHCAMGARQAPRLGASSHYVATIVLSLSGKHRTYRGWALPPTFILHAPKAAEILHHGRWRNAFNRRTDNFCSFCP
jgi:hypothetical protein